MGGGEISLKKRGTINSNEKISPFRRGLCLLCRFRPVHRPPLHHCLRGDIWCCWIERREINGRGWDTIEKERGTIKIWMKSNLQLTFLLIVIEWYCVPWFVGCGWETNLNKIGTLWLVFLHFFQNRWNQCCTDSLLCTSIRRSLLMQNSSPNDGPISIFHGNMGPAHI